MRIAPKLPTTVVTMSGKPRKHHNLRHVLPAAEQAAALLKVGGAGATATSAGELILAAKQKELQGLFEKVGSGH